METVRNVVRGVNEFFFDIEPEEPTDWLSVTLFYGVCGLAVFKSVVCTILLLV